MTCSVTGGYILDWGLNRKDANNDSQFTNIISITPNCFYLYSTLQFRKIARVPGGVKVVNGFHSCFKLGVHNLLGDFIHRPSRKLNLYG